MDLDIYYEDQDVLVVNKFCGMVVYLVFGYFMGIFVNGFMVYCMDFFGINGVMCLGIVYRIDKDMFGLLMVVKNDMVYELFVN